jgi:hypothetical protein
VLAAVVFTAGFVFFFGRPVIFGLIYLWIDEAGYLSFI